jgi:phosphoribosylglycinamide formyltransferase-1
VTKQSKLPVVILISGGGTNLQALIDAAAHDLPIQIRAVISNAPEVYGLTRAADAGIATEVLDHTQFASREAFDRKLARTIDDFGAELVLLAGFMRILTPEFVRHYPGRMLNIHPSLLPRHQGLHTHGRAIEAGDTEHGASVHFVTEELDGGPVIIQAKVPVLTGDTEDILAARVLEKEHIIYPLVTRWFAEGRLQLDNDQVILNGRPLAKPVCLEEQEDSA